MLQFQRVEAIWYRVMVFSCPLSILGGFHTPFPPFGASYFLCCDTPTQPSTLFVSHLNPFCLTNVSYFPITRSLPIVRACQPHALCVVLNVFKSSNKTVPRMAVEPPPGHAESVQEQEGSLLARGHRHGKALGGHAEGGRGAPRRLPPPRLNRCVEYGVIPPCVCIFYSVFCVRFEAAPLIFHSCWTSGSAQLNFPLSLFHS